MTSLHMVGHMVTVAVIATLVKQLMQLRFNLHDLKVELCDQQTDTTEFRNNICEKGSRHGTDQGLSKSTESRTKSDNGRKVETQPDSKTAAKMNAYIDRGMQSDQELLKETESIDENTEAAVEIATDQQKVAETDSNTESEDRSDFSIPSSDELASAEASKELELQSSLQSSVWCFIQENEHCHFQNLCYNTVEDDLFILVGNETVFENVDFSDGSILLELSSVRNHNVHQKYVGSIPVKNSGKLNITWIKETVVLFNRFKPDNLMHVLHDDILPLYHSLRLTDKKHGKSANFKSSKPMTKLVFFEGWDIGEFAGLYQLFSTYPIITKDTLQTTGGIMCFSNAFTGVSKSTVWYDYGFHKPQGPVENFKDTGTMIHNLADYILKHLESSENILPSSSEYLVLLTRKENRKIINEVDLTLGIVQTLGMKVINVNFEMFEFSKLVITVHNSKGIIGMHGSLLSLAMFLKPGSVLVELFPYAVNPNHYTPFKTLASIKGMGIVYKSWRNTDPEKSVGYPERSTDEGGLGHLSEEHRTEIIQQAEVPQHLCCTDPSWLYHIYQDTVVDVAEVLSLVRSALEESGRYSDQSDFSLNPTQVKNVSCTGDSATKKLIINWSIPWTLEYIEENSKSIYYEILLQDMANKSLVKSYTTEIQPFMISLDWESSCHMYVWVKTVRNKTLNGPYSDATECKMRSK